MPSDIAIPIAYPDYQARSDEIDRDVPSGHAGILIVDGNTGVTAYYEYGRYDPPANRGLVRKVTVPNAENKSITVKGLKPAFRKLSQSSGHGGVLKAAWIELSSGAFEKMNTYAQQRLKQNSDPNRASYSITTNNCCTFARDVANAGGATVGLSPGIASYFLQGTIVPHALRLCGSIYLEMSNPVPTLFLIQLCAVYPGVEFKPPDTWTSIGDSPLQTN